MPKDIDEMIFENEEASADSTAVKGFTSEDFSCIMGRIDFWILYESG